MSMDTQIIDEKQAFSRSVELVDAPQLSNAPGVQKISIQGSQRNVTIDLVQDVTSLFIDLSILCFPPSLCARVGQHILALSQMDKYWKYNVLIRTRALKYL